MLSRLSVLSIGGEIVFTIAAETALQSSVEAVNQSGERQ
jgi:hypothetical protein